MASFFFEIEKKKKVNTRAEMPIVEWFVQENVWWLSRNWLHNVPTAQAQVLHSLCSEFRLHGYGISPYYIYFVVHRRVDDYSDS